MDLLSHMNESAITGCTYNLFHSPSYVKILSPVPTVAPTLSCKPAAAMRTDSRSQITDEEDIHDVVAHNSAATLAVTVKLTLPNSSPAMPSGNPSVYNAFLNPAEDPTGAE